MTRSLNSLGPAFGILLNNIFLVIFGLDQYTIYKSRKIINMKEYGADKGVGVGDLGCVSNFAFKTLRKTGKKSQQQQFEMRY